MSRPGRSPRRYALLAGVAAVAACSTSDPSGAPAELKELPRPLTAAEQTVRNSANAFSFALWSRLNAAQPDTNLFVSPLSASFALGMTLNGAAAETFDEMRATLQLGESTQGMINDGYKALIALLTSLDSRVTMDIANSIWYRRDFPFNGGFIDTVRTAFDATVRDLDFGDADGSLAIINGWVSDNTDGKIRTILDDIRDDVMFLINAIYFNGRWRTEFDPAETRDDQFRASDGTTQPVRMMHRHANMAYAYSSTWNAVDLPYGNGAFSMTVVLPGEGVSVDSVAASLTPETWDALTASFAEREVVLALPKFKLTYERDLIDDLKALGMVTPFIPGSADFTRMSPLGTDLFISKVKQKAHVDVHEQGTEAAAVTVVGVGRTSVPPTIRVDRPYLFVIRERLTGTILFMGKVVRMP